MSVIFPLGIYRTRRATSKVPSTAASPTTAAQMIPTATQKGAAFDAVLRSLTCPRSCLPIVGWSDSLKILTSGKLFFQSRAVIRFIGIDGEGAAEKDIGHSTRRQFLCRL